jgi:hypothetical protein
VNVIYSSGKPYNYPTSLARKGEVVRNNEQHQGIKRKAKIVNEGGRHEQGSDSPPVRCQTDG